MRLEVLVSCMDQEDCSIVKKSRLTGDVLIVNQCTENNITEIVTEKQRIRIISTTERGLSNSRNMAIKASDSDICLLCDDDEVFVDNYEKIILDRFCEIPQADIIAFHINNKRTRINKMQRIGRLNSLKLASVQLAFKRNSIIEHDLLFDPLLGAGSGNGCGEENKFLLDCIAKGLKVYFVPVVIANLTKNTSTWFQDYDEVFFYQRGLTTRYMLGLVPSVIYAVYYLLAKHTLYSHRLSIMAAGRTLFKGIRDNRISKEGGCGNKNE